MPKSTFNGSKPCSSERGATTSATARRNRTVCVAPLAPFVRLAESEGVAADRLLAQLGIDRDMAANPWAFVPLELFLNAIDVLAVALDDDALGFRAGLNPDVSSYDAQAYFCGLPEVRSTIRGAFDVVRAAGHLVQPSLIEQGDDLIASMGGIPHDLPGAAHYATFTATVSVLHFRHHLGRWVPIDETHLVQQPPRDRSAFERYFGGTVHFGAAQARWRVPAVHFDRPNVFANPALAAILKRQLDARLRSREDGPGVATRVHQLLASRLNHGTSMALPQVARALGLAPRTLQQHLADSGLQFRAIVEAVRRERAERLLADATLPLSALAEALGFDDTSSLNRACRRWFGKAPSRVRFELRGERPRAGRTAREG